MMNPAMGIGLHGTAELAAFTTHKASLQTYYTIRLLVDRNRVANAFRAYAYFRWVDDRIDGGGDSARERQAFLERQVALAEGVYQARVPFDVTPEEGMLVDLVRSDPSRHNGLATYIRKLMAVMAFDSRRRGRLISVSELNAYSRDLAIAVTEAIHYFIGHDQAASRERGRYLAVMGAHVTHMLRDTYEDIEEGYFNVPQEVLGMRHISVVDVESPGYRQWVKERVELARTYFREGRRFVSGVENSRCRLAYFAYIARFEIVLDMIESDGWVLRPEYGERKSLGSAWQMVQSVVVSSVAARPPRTGEEVLIRRPGSSAER